MLLLTNGTAGTSGTTGTSASATKGRAESGE
jgi:hypothetical protein